MATLQVNSAVPLVVDLDGTLIKTDLLLESVLALVREKPIAVFLLPLWLSRGIAYAKHELARRVSIDIESLPWRTDFIESLRRERAMGRSIILATGSDAKFAAAVAEQLGIFDLVLASDGVLNLSGAAKERELVARFGERGFDYAGDGGGLMRRDRAVWRSTLHAVPVVQKHSSHLVRAALRALRPAHWMKNLLVFVPLIAAHQFDNPQLLTKSILAFIALGLCASSGYLWNDLIDIEADRHHPRKRSRAIASGELPIAYALFAIPMLLAVASVAAALVSPLFPLFLFIYIAMSAAYSIAIKKVAVLDVLFLAALYSVRIMAGSAAVGIWSSYWLLAFSTFLFFSLALVKRYSELMVMRRIDGPSAHARAYELSDAELLAAMGVSSGYLAVTILALYIASEKAEVLYAHRETLWMLCPLLLYWISHVWLKAHRGHMQDDPVVFATSDRTSRILMVLMLACVFYAILRGAAA